MIDSLEGKVSTGVSLIKWSKPRLDMNTCIQAQLSQVLPCCTTQGVHCTNTTKLTGHGNMSAVFFARNSGMSIEYSKGKSVLSEQNVE